jgi:hypothetical protein
MKLSKLLMIALLAGSLGVIGCNDSTTSDNGGNGGGVDPDALCDFEFCAEDSDVGRAAKAACVNEINSCIAAGVRSEEECIAFGTETCNF